MRADGELHDDVYVEVFLVEKTRVYFQVLF